MGGSGDVTHKLKEYLPNALSFIFVINASSAGGMQEDKVKSYFCFISFSLLMYVCHFKKPICFNHFFDFSKQISLFYYFFLLHINVSFTLVLKWQKKNLIFKNMYKIKTRLHNPLKKKEYRK